jgi:hypothetical protein
MELMSLAPLDTTNLFLGVLAATALLELLIVAVLALWLHRKLQQMTRTMEELGTHVAPTLATIRLVSDKASAVLAGAETIVSRVNHAVDAVDGQVRAAASQVGQVTSAFDRVARAGGLQVRALGAGVESGIAALRRPVKKGA